MEKWTHNKWTIFSVIPIVHDISGADTGFRKGGGPGNC